ncbi:hypothetical protein [Lonepinella sp. BR2930]
MGRASPQDIRQSLILVETLIHKTNRTSVRFLNKVDHDINMLI